MTRVRISLLLLVAVTVITGSTVPVAGTLSGPSLEGGVVSQVSSPTHGLAAHTLPLGDDTSTATTTASINTTTTAHPHPKLSSRAATLVATARAGRTDSPLVHQQDGTTTVTLRVEARPGHGDAIASLIDAHNGTIRTRYEHLIVAALPLAAVRAVADAPSVAFVQLPVRARPAAGAVTSEGLDNMHVPIVHKTGVTGQNVTVAVIDVGFNVGNTEISENVAGFRSFDDASMENTSGLHGTAVAELLVDTAPNVTLRLYEIRTETELLNAIEHIDHNTSADIVSMSLGFTTGPFDGTSTLDQAINTSVTNGTAWFVSAGNEADGKHVNVTWSDPDGDGSLNVTPNDETITIKNPAGSQSFEVWVSWTDWASKTEDYDIYLYDDNGNLVDSSTTTQDGTQDPVEAVAAGTGTYHLEIRNASANGTATFTIFSTNFSRLIPNTSAQSLIRPATEEAVIAVGAVNESTNALEAFSSRGPTIDGRQKPAIVAPDGVTTSQGSKSGLNPFYGTSAATPHAAGVAALLLEANRSLSPAGLRQRLQASADPLLGTEPNNRTGYGLVNATEAVYPAGVPRITPTLIVDPGNASAYQTIQAAVDNASDGYWIEVRPGTYREEVTVDKDITILAPTGAVLNGSKFGSSAAAFTVGEAAAPVIRGFTIIEYAVGVNGSASNAPWNVQNVTILHSSRIGVDARETAGDWTLGKTVIRNTSGIGVAARATEGAWTIRATTILQTATDGIDATFSQGNITIQESTVRQAVKGIDASEATGEWVIDDSQLRNNSIGVDAGDTTGNWILRDSRIQNTSAIGPDEPEPGTGVDAENAASDWRILNTTFRSNARIGIKLTFASGNWTIQDTSFLYSSRAVTAGFASGALMINNTTFRNASGTALSVGSSINVLTIYQSTFQENEDTVLGVSATGANIAITQTTFRNNKATVIDAGSSSSDWVIQNTTFQQNSRRAISTSRYTSGDWVIHNSTFDRTIFGLKSSGNWTISNSEGSVNGRQSSGSWTLRNFTGGVNGFNSSSDWTILNSTITNPTMSWSSLNGWRSSGDWRISNTTLVSTSLNAKNSSGNWTIRASIFQGEGGINAEQASGAWSIHDTSILRGLHSPTASQTTTVEASRSSGNWTLQNTSLSHSDVGIVTIGSRSNWTLSNTTIRNMSAEAIFARDSLGHWTIRRSQLHARERGILALNASGDWTLQRTLIQTAIPDEDISGIQRFGLDGVDAYRTSGDWQIRNTTILNSESGISAIDSRGDWIVSNTTIRNSSSSAVNAQDSLGDWAIRSSTLEGEGEGVFAFNASGDWIIHASTIQMDAFGVYAQRASGRWRVNRNTIVETTENGIYAKGAEVEINATYNWWGDPAGPDSNDCVGNVNCLPSLTAPSGALVVATDGGGDYGTIQNAVANASAGDTVWVRNGTYRETVTIDTNLTLIGRANTTLNGSTIQNSTFGFPDGIRIAHGSHVAPTITGFTIVGYFDGIDAGETHGGWTVRDVVITETSGGISAHNTTGDWQVLDATLHHNDYGIFADGATGDWRVYNTVITNNAIGIAADHTTGAWSVRRSTIANTSATAPFDPPGEGVGVYAYNTSGRWAIHRSSLLNNSAAAINATGARIKGNATQNWWGNESGPAPTDCRGNVTCTNPLSAPPAESSVRVGDVNADGTINTGDVIQVQRSIVGLSTSSSFSPAAADVNQDGNVNTGDVIQIQRFIVGLSSVLD